MSLLVALWNNLFNCTDHLVQLVSQKVDPVIQITTLLLQKLQILHIYIQVTNFAHFN